MDKCIRIKVDTLEVVQNINKNQFQEIEKRFYTIEKNEHMHAHMEWDKWKRYKKGIKL